MPKCDGCGRELNSGESYTRWPGVDESACEWCDSWLLSALRVKAGIVAALRDGKTIEEIIRMTIPELTASDAEIKRILTEHVRECLAACCRICAGLDNPPWCQTDSCPVLVLKEDPSRAARNKQIARSYGEGRGDMR